MKIQATDTVGVADYMPHAGYPRQTVGGTLSVASKVPCNRPVDADPINDEWSTWIVFDGFGTPPQEGRVVDDSMACNGATFVVLSSGSLEIDITAFWDLGEYNTITASDDQSGERYRSGYHIEERSTTEVRTSEQVPEFPASESEELGIFSTQVLNCPDPNEEI